MMSHKLTLPRASEIEAWRLKTMLLAFDFQRDWPSEIPRGSRPHIFVKTTGADRV